MTFSDRVKRLIGSFDEKEIDGILISQSDNRYYLSGFHGSAGYLIITQEARILAVDFRYVEQAKRQSPDYEVLKTTLLSEWFPLLLRDLNVKRLGFESADVTYAFFRQLTEVISQAGLSVQLVPVEGLVESLRMVKEPEEIESIRKAVEISDNAVEYIKGIIAPGKTERQIAWEIEKYMREHGSGPVPFDLIVAAGRNAALPHAQPSDYIIQISDPVLVDIGARYQGYTSDITRTFCAGTANDQFYKVYDVVLGAQMAAIALIKQDMTGEEADNLARIVIQEAGYGDAFGHSLGHGVGIATHEMPRLGLRSGDRLRDGMVFTIEPGIYLPEWGGVRIEDTVMMENGKIKVLSKAAK